MPLLHGGELLGRADPARETSKAGDVLIARQASLHSRRAVQPMAKALWEAASWAGCARVRVERVEPAELEAPLRAAVEAEGAAM
jgi:hypothetical protein